MTQTQHAELFSPLRIGRVELKNRIVAPPMVQVRPITSTEGIAWYRRLAAGGAGLVIVEATSIPRFGDDLTPDTLRGLVDAIHAGGAAAAIQLFPGVFGGPIGPDELTVEQIDELVGQFARAADICLTAGFDGVEPHGAHNYPLHAFFMPEKNHRDDEYGGNLDNRCRFALRLVEAIRSSVGDKLLILYRHTPTGGGATTEESLILAERLAAAGVDVMDISPAKGEKPASLAAPFKAKLNVPVIAVGGMQDPGAACEALREDRCDLVAVGRQLIADAEWGERVRTGRLDEIVPCEKCNEGCFGALRERKPVECVQWTGDELEAFLYP